MLSTKDIKLFSSLFIVLWIFRIPVYTSKILVLNLGLPPLRYIEGIFVFIPTAAILLFLPQKTPKTPYLIVFIIFFVGFVFLESDLIRGDVYQPNYGFIINLLNIYWYFLLLVNCGKNEYYYHKILEFSYACTLLIMAIYYLGFINIIDIGVFSAVDFEENIADTRFMSRVFHPNGVSLKFFFGICLLMVFKIKNLRIFNFKLKAYWMWSNIFLFLLIIVLNATRGVFVLSVISILLYFFYSWNNLDKFSKILILPMLLVMTLLINVPSIYNNFYITKRFQNTEFIELESYGRGRQIYATWLTFKNNPWFGAGYQNATSGLSNTEVRSDFSYSQIMASHGFFYFLIYLYFLKKLFTVPNKKFKRFIPVLLFVAGFGPLSFYNTYLCMPLSLVIYLAYYEKLQPNKKLPYVKQHQNSLL